MTELMSKIVGSVAETCGLQEDKEAIQLICNIKNKV